MTTRLPIKTVSESNLTVQSRLAGILKAKRIKDQRSETFYGLLSVWGRLAPPLPLTITLTRIAPRLLDTDNLASSLKHVQDGVADWHLGEYGQGQDRQEGLLWVYDQQRGVPHEYAVLITIDSMQETIYAQEKH